MGSEEIVGRFISSLSATLISRTYHIHVLLLSFDFYGAGFHMSTHETYAPTLTKNTASSRQHRCHRHEFSCFIRCLYWSWKCQFFDNFCLFYSFTLRSYLYSYLTELLLDMPIFVNQLNLLIKLLLDFYLG